MQPPFKIRKKLLRKTSYLKLQSDNYTHVIIYKSPELCNCTLYCYKIRCQYNHLQYNIEWNLMKSTLVSSTAMTLQLQNFTVRYIHRGLLFSYITDRFRIQNKYVLFNTVHIFIILNGALTGNYITFKPSSLPKI